MTQTTCSQCRSDISLNQAICEHCYAAQGLEALAGMDPNWRSQRLARRLSLWLGSFGAHKFYLGEPLRGSLYLLFCWTLVPTVLAIRDSVHLARMAPAQFYRRWCLKLA
ncbi:TM2 domain-containing protein [Ferrimonas balearica]|uniref:TM2 domain-containing protein n=1 Tax=Ferrimonas balearica TaxID=44012 RepID=UPI001FEDE8B3|nr:TM2 domain-containing protein [Ferrimonas balearica]